MKRATPDPVSSSVPTPLVQAKKPRKARITKNYRIIPLDNEQDARFHFNDANINACIEKLDAYSVLDQLRRSEPVLKPIIPITNDLTMVVHNVVLTTELFEKSPGPAAPPTNMLLSRYDDDDDESSLSMEYPFEAPKTVALDQDIQNYSDSDSDSDNEDLGKSLKPIATARGTFETEDFRVIQQFVTSNDPLAVYGGDHTATAQIAKTVESSSPPGENYYTIPIQKLNYYMRQFGTQLNMRRFTATILRNDELSSATLIFGTVKLITTGCARPELALITLQDALDKIRQTGYDQFKVPVPKLRNIVSNGCFPRQICTFMMAVMYSNCCRRITKFPAVTIRTKNMDTRAILLFDSGQTCHSGATSPAEVHADYVEIYPMVLNCIRTRQTSKINLECLRLIKMDPNAQETRKSINEMREKLLANVKPRKSAAVAATANI